MMGLAPYGKPTYSSQKFGCNQLLETLDVLWA